MRILFGYLVEIVCKYGFCLELQGPGFLHDWPTVAYTYSGKHSTVVCSVSNYTQYSGVPSPSLSTVFYLYSNCRTYTQYCSVPTLSALVYLHSVLCCYMCTV